MKNKKIIVLSFICLFLLFNVMSVSASNKETTRETKLFTWMVFVETAIFYPQSTLELEITRDDLTLYHHEVGHSTVRHFFPQTMTFMHTRVRRNGSDLSFYYKRDYTTVESIFPSHLFGEFMESDIARGWGPGPDEVRLLYSWSSNWTTPDHRWLDLTVDF